MAKAFGSGLMVIVVMCQGAGLALGAALKSFQGSFSIVGVGTPITAVVTVVKKGTKARGERITLAALISPDVWREGIKSLRWSNFTRAQQWVIIGLAVSSAAINLGGPLAVREIGPGLNASFSTAGGLLAGLLLLRFAPQWVARGVVLAAVVFAAFEGGQGDFSTLGLVAAVAAASHMWNLPRSVARLGNKSDEGLTLANLISAPFVLVGTFGWDRLQGVSWQWGTKELIGAVCAGVLVMVIPIFLQNAAEARGLKEQDMGALQSLASPVHALMGVLLTPITLALTGKVPDVPTLSQWGFFIVVAGTAIAVPWMPKDNSWKKAQSERDEANARVAELTRKLREVTDTLREVTAERTAADGRVGLLTTQRDTAVRLFNEADTARGRLKTQLDAMIAEAASRESRSRDDRHGVGRVRRHAGRRGPLHQHLRAHRPGRQLHDRGQGARRGVPQGGALQGRTGGRRHRQQRCPRGQGPGGRAGGSPRRTLHDHEDPPREPSRRFQRRVGATAQDRPDPALRSVACEVRAGPPPSHSTNVASASADAAV